MTIQASTVALRTKNPIRDIVDKMKVVPNPEKEFISLALGDPTTFGNFKLHDSCVQAVVHKLQSFKANGYPPSIGTKEARQAIANGHTTTDAPLTADDVILASGCSDALNLCIGVLCNEGDNILLPAPGFSLYETLASSKAIECKFYNLLPEKQWEMDLKHLESLIDSKTKCILINNPSNPCGSVYSKQHLLGLLDIAERHHLPVISDEIYADMVFEGFHFYPLATLTKKVPILTCGGLAKKFLVPGWRVGWVMIHDRENQFEQVRKGLVSLSQLTLGANSLIQSAIPEMLQVDPSFHEQNMKQLETNARTSRELLQGVPGIKPVFPQGAMYLMLEIQLEHFPFKDDLEFVEVLAKEESVLCLPGQCFRCPKPFVRIVFSPPKDKLEIAFGRIRTFCERHFR
ncbi:pyridoxal phosphate-dependent transferase [Gorgonomyces haynaldii]|nr:pyridoxal phosphate-dependent transferase [Gorgonomyces haynaldii]